MEMAWTTYFVQTKCVYKCGEFSYGVGQKLWYKRSMNQCLTHLLPIPHIYASVNWPNRQQAFSEIQMEIQNFSFLKIHLKMASAKIASIFSRGRWVNVHNTNKYIPERYWLPFPMLYAIWMQNMNIDITISACNAQHYITWPERGSVGIRSTCQEIWQIWWD